MTDNVTASAFDVNNDVTGGFSTGDIWRAASDKSPFHRGCEARQRKGKDFGKSKHHPINYE